MDWIWQLGACIASVVWTSSHSTSTIIDYGHVFLPLVPSEFVHILCASLAAYSYTCPSFTSVFLQVYAPAMFIKATLIPFTIVPDANPECHSIHIFKCLTRNDMLPSGHMLAASCAALAIHTWWAYLMASLCGVLLVASRMHYVVDVTLSVWIVALLYK